MQIRNLANTSLQTIVNCTTTAFADYFVKMPDSVPFWESRYHRARIDYTLSFGVFDKDQLVAFIMTGIDYRNGKLTAFNSGTGVIPSHRGQKLVDQIYTHALPLFKARGVQQCQLEVIEQNHRAIRVYERIGFHRTKLLHIFKGQYTGPHHPVKITETDFQSLIQQGRTNNALHSWDNSDEAIIMGGDFFKTYTVENEQGNYVGYFVVNPKVGYLAQFECADEDLSLLLSGVAQLSEAMASNNIDEKRVGIIKGLPAYGLENVINQYEMEMTIL